MPVEDPAPATQIPDEPCSTPCADSESCQNEAPQEVPSTGPEDLVANALKGIDISKVTPDDVFRTIMGHSQEFALRLMCSARLMEQIMLFKASQNESQEPVQPPSDQN